jgi:hypothetical protein
MAIYTPRGLEINLRVPYAFALMQRLYPKVDAFKVLKTTEGLESIPAALAFSSGLACFYLKVGCYHIALYSFIFFMAGVLITFLGLMVPVLPSLGTFYSCVSGFGILLVGFVVYGFVTVGWRGVMAFFAGRWGAGIVGWVIDFWNTKRIYARHHVLLHLSELNFLNAYRWYATEPGAAIIFGEYQSEFRRKMDITVSDEEMKEENWRACFDDLALRWPEVVSRFTDSKMPSLPDPSFRKAWQTVINEDDPFAQAERNIGKLSAVASRTQIAKVMTEFGMSEDPLAEANSLYEHYRFLLRCGIPSPISLKGLSKPNWFRLSLELRRDGASPEMIQRTLTDNGQINLTRGSSPMFGGIVPWVIRKSRGF